MGWYKYVDVQECQREAFCRGIFAPSFSWFAIGYEKKKKKKFRNVFGKIIRSDLEENEKNDDILE